METDIVDRWEKFKTMDERVKFDMYIEGRVALQKVTAIENCVDDGGSEKTLKALLGQDRLNTRLLLEHGAVEE